MEYKIHIIDQCKQEIEFDIPAGELIPHFEDAYLSYRNKMSVSGFRKGKAPITMIKKLYGETIEQNSLEGIASDAFNKYIKDNKIFVLGEGAITDLKYSPGTNLKFKILFEVKPEFELGQYKGLEVTKPVYEVDDRMIEEEIRYLQSKHCTYEEVQLAEDEESVITIDLQKLDNNNFPIIGNKQENIKIYLKDSSLEEEFRSQLQGIRTGETRIVKLRNRDKDETETYSLKAVKIERIIFPELSHDFFSKIASTDIKEITEFKEFIRSDLEKVYSRVSERELENTIISELIKLNDVTAPDVLVERILLSRIDELKSKSPKRELPGDFNEEEFRKNTRVDAVLQVKWLFIRDKIIETEKIEVAPEEIENSVLEYAGKYDLPVDKVRKLFNKNDDLKNNLLNRKLMDFLKKNSVIKEIEQSHPAAAGRIYA